MGTNMKREEFNKAIIEGKGATEDDPEIQNWVATQFGRHFAGVEAESEDALPETCQCGRAENIARRRLNTAYADDEQNWLVSCLNCFEQEVEMYEEMWADYWSMVL